MICCMGHPCVGLCANGKPDRSASAVTGPIRLSRAELDEWLTDMIAGLPGDTSLRWVLRCHPSVYQAISYVEMNEGPAAPALPRFGPADVVVTTGLDDGEWELRLADASPEDAPARWGNLNAFRKPPRRDDCKGGYCRGSRSVCTCQDDCGARGETDGHHCPRAEGYVEWLRGTGLYSEEELARLAERGAR